MTGHFLLRHTYKQSKAFLGVNKPEDLKVAAFSHKCLNSSRKCDFLPGFVDVDVPKIKEELSFLNVIAVRRTMSR